MRVIIKLNHLLFLMIMISTTSILGLVKFTIPKTNVVHTKSGLILHYLSEYRPANKIITFTVTIPMYSDMCYLILTIAMEKITECLDKEELGRNTTLLYIKSSQLTISIGKTIILKGNNSIKINSRSSDTITKTDKRVSREK